MNEKFTELIKMAIGDERTQKQFAAESGISAEHLSRIIRNPEKHTPTESTLEKIADHSEGRVSVADLKSALDMEISAEDKKTQIGVLPPARRNAIVAGDMKKGIKELFLSRPVRYGSFEEMFDILHMLYGWGEFSYKIEKDEEYDTKINGQKGGAERFASFTVSWDDEESLCQMAFILYFCKTEGNGIIITDAAFDLDTLIKYGHPLAYEAEALMEGDGTDPDDYTLVYLTSYHKTPILSEKEDACNEFDIFAERLLNAAKTKEELLALETVIKRMRADN